MHICRPVFLVKLAVIAVRLVAECGDIVGERINPDIDDVLVIERNRNAPLDRGTGNAEILESLLNEVIEHFLLACLRIDKVRILLDELFQPALVFAQLEEVCLLTGVADLSAAVRAFAVHQLRLRPEALAGGAVFSDIFALIDIALIVELLEDALHAARMLRVGGADKLRIGNIEQLADALDLTCNLINVLLRRNAGFLRDFFDLLAVLIGAGQEIYIIALHSAEPGKRVGHDNFIGIADVRLARGIRDGSGQIIRFMHDKFLLSDQIALL